MYTQLLLGRRRLWCASRLIREQEGEELLPISHHSGVYIGAISRSFLPQLPCNVGYETR
jgi:hypothetical protein